MPQKGQVLIKVHFAAVNHFDWKLMSGGMSDTCPVSFPYTPGFDVSGVIAKLGPGVKGLKVGDTVCVSLLETCKQDIPIGPAGGFAQYAIALAETVSKTGLALEKAVVFPMVGLATYQALFTGAGKTFLDEELGKLKSGKKLLVLGGSTLAGMFAIQMAYKRGCTVACTASQNKMGKVTKLKYMKKLGAKIAIDYNEQDWSEVLAGKKYDMIFDCSGKVEDWPKANKVLKPGGQYVSIANFSGAVSTQDHNFKFFVNKSNRKDLKQVLKMGLKPHTHKIVEFDKVQEALASCMYNECAGKLVIRVAGRKS
jgi:NADPH2:quinone reductase